MRTKTVPLVILIVFTTTAATFFSGLYFSNNSLIETMEQDLAFAIGIADDLVSNKMELIKSSAAAAAIQLRSAGSDEELEEMLREEYDNAAEVSGLSVFDRNGIIAAYSEPAHVHDVDIKAEHLEMVLNGRTIISSPFYCSVTKEFVMNVYTFLSGERVLAVTIPGLTFSDLLANHRLWQSGHIFMLDENGTFIGSANQDIVLAMSNYATGSVDPSELEEGRIGGLIRNILSTESGVYQYTFEDTERICAYSLINGTVLNWHVAVTVLLSESPQSDALQGHMSAAVLSLIVGTAAAFFLSRLVERPYKKIEAQNRELEALMTEVENANNTKSAFLAKISHEMRTPLNSVIGLSEITLGINSLDEDAKGYLEKIYNSGFTLLSIVNDVLDISKIQSGNFEILPVEYDVPSLINDTVLQNVLYIGSKPVRFILNVDENTPARLFGDELRVKQIINNLLSNAIKYTEQGEVELNISSRRGDSRSDGGNQRDGGDQHEHVDDGRIGGSVFDSNRRGEDIWLTFSVRDTGIGISEENLEQVFNDYMQFGASSRYRLGGTGLGLAITKNLIEMMDGNITVSSRYGEGSIFTGKIRQRFVSDKVIGREASESLKNFQYNTKKLNRNSRFIRVQLPHARVLIVDDNITNLDVARGIMKPYGMSIDCVTSGMDAIRAVESGKFKYDAVFMDHMMPEMDGVEAVHHIRGIINTDYARTVPIIALTANAIAGSEEMFLENGFNGFISKPIDLVRLDEVIRKFIHKDGRNQHAGAASGARPAYVLLIFGADIKGIDLEAGLDTYGDEKAYIQILRSFAVNTKPLLDSVGNAVEERLEEYAVTVHGIKGAGRNIFAEPLSLKAEDLEHAANVGDWDYVRENNPAFIDAAEKLIAEINALLEKYAAAHPKEKKDKPDGEILLKLYSACADYDFSLIDEAMEEIERYDYTEDGGLAEWLRESIIKVDLVHVMEKLNSLNIAK